MKPCENCEQGTDNPRFCSRSCSTTYFNKVSPRRKALLKQCTSCTAPLSNKSRKRYCESCSKSKTWALRTLGEVRATGNAVGGTYAYVRQLARKAYSDSGLPQACAVCGYDRHVEISHRFDIQRFDDSALVVSDVNALSNLIALCRNHHWEFDYDGAHSIRLGLTFTNKAMVGREFSHPSNFKDPRDENNQNSAM